MTSTKNLIPLPDSMLSKTVSIEPYIALLDTWSTHRLRSEGLIGRLCDSAVGGGYYFDDRHLPAFHPRSVPYHMPYNPLYVAKLTSHLPTHETFSILRNVECRLARAREYHDSEGIYYVDNLPYGIHPTRLDIALDITFATVEDARVAMLLINSAIVKKYRRKNASIRFATRKAGDQSQSESKSGVSDLEDEEDVVIEKYESEPPYEDYDFEDDNPPADDNEKVRYTDRHQAPLKIVTYFKEKCPINGLPAVHIEYRIIRYQALNRRGIYTLTDVWNFNIEEFLYRNFELLGIDDRTLERIGKISMRDTRTRKSHSTRYKNRTDPLAGNIQYLSSYKNIGSKIIKRSSHEYHGDVYTDVQDVLDRLKQGGVIMKNIRQYFPRYDLSILNL